MEWNRRPQLQIAVKRRFFVPAWIPLGFFLFLIIFISCPANSSLPMALLSAVAFFTVQLFWPKCRLSSKTIITPANLAQVIFGFQLVILPLHILIFGLSLGRLPVFPSELATNVGLGLSTLAYVAYSAGFNRSYRPGHLDASRAEAQVWYPTKRMLTLVFLFFLLGLLGFYLFTGNFSGYLNYLATPFERISAEDTISGKLGAAISTFLKPFLGFAVVLAWSLWVDRKRRIPGMWLLPITTVAVSIILIFVSLGFFYNRGAVAGPILALAAAYILRVRRIPPAVIYATGALLLGVLLLVAPYRQSDLSFRELAAEREQLEELVKSSVAINDLQVYGGGPQFVGFLIEESNFGKRLYWGKTLIASVLYPIPMLGKRFRASSGLALYNTLIYNDTETIDQITPFSAELFINFHVVGLILGFSIIGLAIARLQDRFSRSRNTFEAYVIFLFSIWITFLIPGSVSVTSQMMVFAFWPIYIYMGLCWLSRKTPDAAGARKA